MRGRGTAAKLVLTWLGGFLSLCILANAPTSYAQASSSKVGVASFSEKEFNFGAIPQGAKVTHEFEIENRGEGELLIERLTPSCGCTATTVTASVIKPDSTEKIRVEFDSAGFSGPKVKTVEVLTNDRENRRVVLTLRGEVVPGASASPSRIEFGALSPGAGSDQRVKRLQIDIADKSLHVGCRARSFSRFLPIRRLGEAEGSGHAPTFEVELLPDAPKGEFRDRILVECDGGRLQPISIPVTAFVQGDLRLRPSIVAFGVITGTTPFRRKVVVESSSPEEVVVEQVIASHDAVTASYHRKSGSKGSRRELGVVELSVDPVKVKGALQATVTLVTSHPVEKEIVMTVTGVSPPQ